MSRYDRQRAIIGDDGQKALSSSVAVIIGCGGLGCQVATNLASAGISGFILFDGDSVTESNLNRQFAHRLSIGRNKAVSLSEWISELNPDASVDAHPVMFGDDYSDVIGRADIVMDCLDDPQSRLTLGRICRKASKIIVHGGIDGFAGQVAVIRPEGNLTMDSLFSGRSKAASDSISSAVSVIGSIQANEAVKILLGKEALSEEILTVDLLFDSFVRVSLYH